MNTTGRSTLSKRLRVRQMLLVVFSLALWSTSEAQIGIQSYTPSILLKKDQWELKSFYNFYHQTRRFGEDHFSREKDGDNVSQFGTVINSFLYGTGGNINVGFDLWLRHVHLEGDQMGSRFAVSGFGPKIKWVPFKNQERLSIQTLVLFPVADDLESRASDAANPGLFLDFDRTLWLTQFFYDKPIGDKFQLFFQQAFWMSFVRNSFRNNSFLQTQTSIFGNYFVDDKWTFYAMTEFFPTHYDDPSQEFDFVNNYFVQSGVGVKRQLILNKLEAEILVTHFWAGSEGGGAGNTYNLGLRYLR